MRRDLRQLVSLPSPLWELPTLSSPAQSFHVGGARQQLENTRSRRSRLAMIIDGETYACEGCIRGHRARNCQHNGELQSTEQIHRVIADRRPLDRPLQHIKAKGRPVSQCNHCRSERKNRSAHVKCQCGKRASEGGSGKQAPVWYGIAQLRPFC